MFLGAKQGYQILTCTSEGICTISSCYCCALRIISSLCLLEAALTSSTFTAFTSYLIYNFSLYFGSSSLCLSFSLDLSLFSLSFVASSSAQWMTVFLIYLFGAIPIQELLLLFDCTNIKPAMSILRNVELQGNEVASCTALISSITTPLTNALMAYRNFFTEAGKHSDILYASSKRIFDALNQETTKVLSKLEKKMHPAKSIDKPAKKVCLQLANAVQPSKNSVKIQCIDQKSSNKLSKNVLDQKQKPIYFCFQCFQQRNAPNPPYYFWQSEEYYLSHLKKYHNLEPTFEVVMLSSSGIPFSHVYFHGELVNIFRNSPIDDYVRIYTNFKQEVFSKIYACRCLLEDRQFTLGELPIFAYSFKYFQHITSCHSGVTIDGSSHCLYSYGKEKISYFRINKRSNIFTYASTNPKIMAVIGKIEAAIEETANLSVSSFLVGANPLRKLEMVSRLGLQWKDAFLALPGVKSEPTLKDLREYLQTRKSKMKEEVKLSYLSDEENQMINLQVSLLNPAVLICGECSHRSPSEEEYISHIYLAHNTINALNSHRLLFLDPS